VKVELNPILCTAHGLCADLLPERIALDEWGYPILEPGELPDDVVAHARRAARACPTRALVLSRG
jgi:ferredoxin